MAIQKKSLIAALKTAKTANLSGAKSEADATKIVSTKFASTRAVNMRAMKSSSFKQIASKKSALRANLRSLKAAR